MSLFTKIAAAFKKLWASLKPELQVVIDDSIKVVSFFVTFLGNATVDELLTAISGGLITPAAIATLNAVLKELLEKLYDAQQLENMAENEKLVLFSTTFNSLNDSQKSAILKQAATQYALASGKVDDEAKLDAKLTSTIQARFSGLIT